MYYLLKKKLQGIEASFTPSYKLRQQLTWAHTPIYHVASFFFTRITGIKKAFWLGLMIPVLSISFTCFSISFSGDADNDKVSHLKVQSHFLVMRITIRSHIYRAMALQQNEQEKCKHLNLRKDAVSCRRRNLRLYLNNMSKFFRNLKVFLLSEKKSMPPFCWWARAL